LKNLEPTDHKNYRNKFLEQVYFSDNYRKITKEEACMIQGFPKDFILPESRARWMKLIGNSVSVPVINVIIKSIISTGVFDGATEQTGIKKVQNTNKNYSVLSHLVTPTVP
jgi:DNA (cytosine-5)-methyltransferase 1